MLCCGYGSALIWRSWIRIQNGNADPGPGTLRLPKINKKNLVSCLSERFLYLRKSDQDPEPPGSALVYLPGSGSALILKLDPDPHWNQCGSTLP
jgi:hypothetical protein